MFFGGLPFIPLHPITLAGPCPIGHLTLLRTEFLGSLESSLVTQCQGPGQGRLQGGRSRSRLLCSESLRFSWRVPSPSLAQSPP